MTLCPKCNRKKRVNTYRRKISGVDYWVAKCVECGTDITLDPIDPPPAEPPPDDRDPRKRKRWFKSDLD